MVWHTYTTGSSSTPTPFQPTTSSGFETLVTTSDPVVTQTVPMTKMTKQTLKVMTTTTTQSYSGGQGESQGEWRSDVHGNWIWYPSFDSTLTTKDQADVRTSSPSSVSSTTPTTVSATSTGSSQSTSSETLSTSVLQHTHSTTTTPTTTPTTQTSVRDQEKEDAINRTNRTFTTVTSPNILPSLSTTTPLLQSTAEKLSTEGNNNVIFNMVTSTIERPRSSTVDDENGYWLVDEQGKKLIYVKPNATGHYADAWRQFIGAVTPTAQRPGHGGQSSWITRRPSGMRHPPSGEPCAQV